MIEKIQEEEKRLEEKLQALCAINSWLTQIVLNGTRPVEVEAVEVTGISLRDPFLKRQLRALLQPGLTVKSLFDGVEVVSEKLAAVPVLSDVNISLDSKPSEKLAKLGGISVKATISAIQRTPAT